MEEQETQYFWELTLKDDTTIEIPPSGVDVVKRRMANKDAINLRTRSIPYSEVKGFRQTDKRFSTIPLLDEAARAFNEPIYTETIVERNGEEYKYVGVKAAWVKKQVTQDRWQNYYSKTMNKKLDSDSGMVTIAFVLPVHSIDLNEVQYCTEEEIAKLERT